MTAPTTVASNRAGLFDELVRVRIALEEMASRLDVAATPTPACDVAGCPILAEEHRRG